MNQSIRIARVQIEGGFLDGLDLELTEGLNVLIGGRGTGKTSIIELIRFGLGLETLSRGAQDRVEEHVAFALGDGEVTLTFEDDSQITRSLDDDVGLEFADGNEPLFLSQMEIESIGVSTADRMRLIDEFHTQPTRDTAAYESALAKVRSLTQEISAHIAQANELQLEVETKASLTTKLDELVERQSEIADRSEAIAEKRDALDSLDESLSETDWQLDVLLGTQSNVEELADEVAEISGSFEELSSDIDTHFPDELSEAKKSARQVTNGLAEAVSALNDLSKHLDKAHSSREKGRSRLRQRARILRREIDGFEKGAGDLSRAISKQRASLSRLQSFENELAKIQSRTRKLMKSRDKELDVIETYRATRRAHRVRVANSLNESLSPSIRVSISGESRPYQYTEAIKQALRGSRLWANVADVLTEALTPRELVVAAETGDEDLLVEECSLSQSRAARLLGVLAESESLADILLAEVEDDVSLELLDGGEYKGIDRLSTGQRCTVVLPILLEQSGRLLAIDQPEDHLDNAFVASTLVTALAGRKCEDQLIISTHNPNIPVLGECENAIVLESDGRKGYVKCRGPFDDPSIISFIIQIMEGGEEAFRERTVRYRSQINV